MSGLLTSSGAVQCSTRRNALEASEVAPKQPEHKEADTKTVQHYRDRAAGHGVRRNACSAGQGTPSDMPAGGHVPAGAPTPTSPSGFINVS